MKAKHAAAYTMPFGQFKGVRLNALPPWYLSWLGEIELREPLRSKVEEEIGRREKRDVDLEGEDEPVDLHVFTADELRRYARSIVEVGFRELSKRWHPDAGGSTEKMVGLIHAAKSLRKSLPVEPIQ